MAATRAAWPHALHDDQHTPSSATAAAAAGEIMERADLCIRQPELFYMVRQHRGAGGQAWSSWCGFRRNERLISLRQILVQSDRWIEKGDLRSKTKSCILTQSRKCLFDPSFFDRAIRSAHPVEKNDFFNGMHGSDCSIERVFEAHTASLTNPENTQSHPTTAPMLA